VSVFREAEGEAARCFDGVSQVRVEALHASAGTRLAASAIPAGGGLGLAGMGAYRPSPFHHWTVIRGFERVTNGNTFVQVGPTCTLYSALNLLRFSGHPVNGRMLTQAGADQIAQGVAQRNWWRPDILVTNSPELGYAMSEARRILDTHGAAYTFSTARNFAYAPNAAEQYLVYTVQTQQKPVLVATKWSAVMGLPLSSHAYNVIGVHTDNQGRLEHVLVSTNWAGQNAFMEIPAREFLDAWKKNDYETIVLN
jgi:hypothetical protein